jgi:hypothetical protein
MIVTQIIPAYVSAGEMKNLDGIPLFHLTSVASERCYIAGESLAESKVLAGK